MNVKLVGNLDNLNLEVIVVFAEGKLIFVDGGVINIIGELVGKEW